MRIFPGDNADDPDGGGDGGGDDGDGDNEDGGGDGGGDDGDGDDGLDEDCVALLALLKLAVNKVIEKQEQGADITLLRRQINAMVRDICQLCPASFCREADRIRRLLN